MARSAFLYYKYKLGIIHISKYQAQMVCCGSRNPGSHSAVYFQGLRGLLLQPAGDADRGAAS